MQANRSFEIRYFYYCQQNQDHISYHPECFLFFPSFFQLFYFTICFFFTVFTSSCALLNWYSIVLAFFSASFCFSCASSTASTDDLFTCICNLEFWSRTSFYFFFELLLFAPALQAVSVPQIVVALLKDRFNFCVSDSSVVKR